MKSKKKYAEKFVGETPGNNKQLEDRYIKGLDISLQKKFTISSVTKDELCTGCGTCVALCPMEAIELSKDEEKGIFVPRINENRCDNCGICLKACPGHGVDFKSLNLEIFGKEPKSILIGNYVRCFVGHATDYSIRYNSASGGLITALLIFLLEEGIINGVLVTRMKRDKPLEPEPFIARTKEEIIESSKSKYCPVPANIALKEILNAEDGMKFAVVGLPCHIHGMRKAERINEKLREKIILHVGLFCSRMPNFLGTAFLQNKLKIKKEDIRKLDYRGEGWPGGMSIELKRGGKRFIPYSVYYNPFGLDFFIPKRCLLCSDGTNELADISFGDAWLPEFSEDKVGTSIVIVRNIIAERFLRDAVTKEKIKLEEISAEKVKQSQSGMLYSKKKVINCRIKLLKSKIKFSNTFELKCNILDYFAALTQYFNMYLSSKQFFKYTPLRALQIYSIAISHIYRILKGKVIR